MSSEIRRLHGAIVDLMALMNQPQRDIALMREAGIELDRALFPLLVGIDRFGPIGVVELADKAGRDYTTVSRQVSKLADLKLITRRSSPDDKRMRQAAITPKGKEMIEALHSTRERLAGSVLADWSERDLRDLARLMRRLTGDLKAWKGA
jgi:DNA-binding MarR family transcriptional regulator